MSDEERRKQKDEVDIERLDPVELANNYGHMVEPEEEPPITMKPVSTLENMDPETGDFIRPPKESLNLPGEIENEVVEEKEPKEKEKRGKRHRRERKISKQSTKEFTRQLSQRIMKNINPQRKEEDENSDEEGRGNNCIFGTKIRFTIMLISTLCLSSILSNILTYNFAFICMAGDRPANYSNMTEIEKLSSGYREDLDYSSMKRSILFMAVAVGALMAVFPMTVALGKFGSRMVFGILGFVSAIATFLIPISADIGFPAMVVMRIFQGVGFSACLPVMGSITSHWSTTSQTGIFMAILSSFLQIRLTILFHVLLLSEFHQEFYMHGQAPLSLFTNNIEQILLEEVSEAKERLNIKFQRHR